MLQRESMRGKANPDRKLRRAARTARRLQWLPLALWVVACAAAAAPPKQVIVTREAQDLYRVAAGSFYIKTLNCHEFVYGDRADLKLNIGVRGGTMVFRNARACAIDKLLREIDPSTMQPTMSP
jgi:hypothetical protein